MLSTHPPLVRVFSLGSACTAEAARNAAIKSAAAAAGGESRRDDFMVTNYIDGTIRRAARTLSGGGESQRSLQHLFFCCRWPLAAGQAPFNLRRHRETTSHLAGSGWSDCTSVWCDDIFLFSLGNPDWIILCSIYMSLRFLLGPHGALQQHLSTHHLVGLAHLWCNQWMGLTLTNIKALTGWSVSPPQFAA